ncbi:hypothetical protein MLD38_003210 [Melastoma candidum]|uniref:Uncharacterized protein n=1 Tax=Melastoma candidum TaxID=119954 RepID=A0ACB9S1L3_9MYRT|nr:hypothetical protein MLD38_003210 [Melastoma candidum]
MDKEGDRLAIGPIIARSKAVHDTVASVPLDKVNYANVVAPLAEVETELSPLVQSCVFPKLVSTSENVRRASTKAEGRIDTHNASSSLREDVYRVVKAYFTRGEWTSPEANCFVKCLVKDFERNGLNLTSTMREEVHRLKSQIDELSLQYVQNLNDDRSFLLFSGDEVVGIPAEFLESLDAIGNTNHVKCNQRCSRVGILVQPETIMEKTQSGKYKVKLRKHHVGAILEHFKIAKTRRSVAVAYGKRSSFATNRLSCWVTQAMRRGSKDPISILTDFLGREPSRKAFIDIRQASM